MASFLQVEFLRAHAAPELPAAVFDQAGQAAARNVAAPARKVLTARWIIAPDGRLTCRWQADLSAPFRPPPD
jgi:hypothetical protein